MLKTAMQVSPGWEWGAARTPCSQHWDALLSTKARASGQAQPQLLGSRTSCRAAWASCSPNPPGPFAAVPKLPGLCSRVWHPASTPCTATSAVQPCRLCLPALSRAAAFNSNRGDSQVTVTLGLCQQSQALQRRAPSQE